MLKKTLRKKSFRKKSFRKKSFRKKSRKQIRGRLSGQQRGGVVVVDHLAKLEKNYKEAVKMARVKGKKAHAAEKALRRSWFGRGSEEAAIKAAREYQEAVAAVKLIDELFHEFSTSPAVMAAREKEDAIKGSSKTLTPLEAQLLDKVDIGIVEEIKARKWDGEPLDPNEEKLLMLSGAYKSMPVRLMNAMAAKGRRLFTRGASPGTGQKATSSDSTGYDPDAERIKDKF